MRDNNAKPDGMIDGRESGLAPGLVAKPWHAAPITAQKTPPLNFQNDKAQSAGASGEVSADVAPARGRV
jgi:hypothetical protein